MKEDRMRVAYYAFLAAVVLAALLGCERDNGVYPGLGEPSELVISFVKTQQVPDVESISQVFVEPGIEIFSVEYGEPLDCPSGCFYWRAVGIRVHSRVAWLYSQVEGNFELEREFIYTYRPGEDVVVDSGFWDRMSLHHQLESVLWQGILYVVAHSQAVPRDSLVDLVERLYSYVAPEVAGPLVDNCAQRGDKELLVLLCNLPVLDGDPYARARISANRALRRLGRGER